MLIKNAALAVASALLKKQTVCYDDKWPRRGD
jgi:hypothetical protein